MVTWGDVTNWSGEPLGAAVGSLNSEYNELIAAGEDLRGINTPCGWTGPAATAAAARGNELIDGLEEWAAEIAAARRAAGDVSDAITGLLSGVREAEELARVHHFTIADDGAVVDQGPPPDVPPEQREAVAAERRAIAAELAERVRQVLRTAEDIDDDFCVVLDRILAADTIDAGANDNQNTSLAAAGNAGAALGSLSIPAPPPADATPAQNAAWWATLSEGQRTQLAMDRPVLVGPRDGVSAKQRDIANRILLDRELSRLQADRNSLQHQIDTFPRTGAGQIKLNDQLEFDELTAQLEQLDGKIRGMEDLVGKLAQSPDTPEEQRLHLLGINSDNLGQAIVAQGNPDLARDVATFVPGTGSGLHDVVANMDRSARMLSTAQDAGSTSTAVITWAGYDAPPTIPDAASTSYADNAEQRLHDFQAGLREAHQGTPANTTVIGHSYGTTAIGQTARDLGLAADKVVFAGSPGVGVEHASQLKLDDVSRSEMGNRVFSTASPTDPIPYATNFRNPILDGVDPLGPDPTQYWFGGQSFGADAGDPGTSHSAYWDRNSTSLREMGRIIAGS
ncbi:Alpha/beta hydrolase [Amycolatopsis arida]|uniref:Alpha/beta hydrolase n=1 Tax=Amycolatopsis arida TaxID=587909 RepID=A0A1I5YGJ4_9PSEU|nr:alpha/beta hydrolase [Amycolatopsis arida]TDX90499.1 alpha/beta hydrolase family protein [Amycolatopsis arida]SFQ43344.1 Alpha/beta hydrolase [Amycolatopsis arida]